MKAGRLKKEEEKINNSKIPIVLAIERQRQKAQGFKASFRYMPKEAALGSLRPCLTSALSPVKERKSVEHRSLLTVINNQPY